MSSVQATLLAVIGITLGISSALLSLLSTELALLFGGLGLLQLFVFFLRKKKQDYYLAQVTLLISFGIVIGILRTQLVEDKSMILCEKRCEIRGTVSSPIKIQNALQSFSLTPEADVPTYDILVKTTLYPEYREGEKLSVIGVVKEPKVLFPHDGKKSFDYVSYLETKSIGSEAWYPSITPLATSSSNSLFLIKEEFIKRITLFIDQPASALASGMLFGNSTMSSSLTTTFRTSGLSHIVVLSGFNIAIVIAFVFALLFFVPYTMRVIIAMVATILFVVMVSGEASVIRATLMAFLALVASALGRGYEARQALLLSFLAIIMYEPKSLLYDVSLHLSFLATAGIIFGTPLIEEFATRISFLKQSPFVKSTTAISLSAYLATLPYVAYSFGTVSVYALFANILVVPFVPLAMLLTFLTVACSYFFEPLALLLGAVTSVLINGIMYVATFIEGLPISSLTVSVTFFGMTLSYAVLSLLVMWRSRIVSQQESGSEEHETQSTSLPSQVLTGSIRY